MSAMASQIQITGASIVCSAVCSGADQRKHQSSASLAFVRGIHRWPENFPHTGASNTENVSIWWRSYVQCRGLFALPTCLPTDLLRSPTRLYNLISATEMICLGSCVNSCINSTTLTSQPRQANHDLCFISLETKHASTVRFFLTH